MENVQKHRDIKLVTANNGRSHTTSLLHNKMVFIKSTDKINEQNRSKNGQAGVFRPINFPHQQNSDVCVLVSYIRPKYQDKTKPYYKETDRLIV